MNKEVVNALLSDHLLQRLEAQRLKIYSLAVPKILIVDGIPQTVWFDDINNEHLKQIEDAINFRTNQITEAYSKPNSQSMAF